MEDSFFPAATGFTRNFVKCNNLDEDGFEEWFFYPGMLFGEMEKWWERGGSRSRPHEGLDLRYYRDREGRILSLGRNARIPLLYPGRVIRTEEDFLGTSVYVMYDMHENRGYRLVTVYGHIEPVTAIGERYVDEGRVIGTIANASGEKLVPPHLHLSVLLTSPSLRPQDLGWKTMDSLRDAGMIVFLDPLAIIV